MEELTARAAEAIRVCRENMRTERWPTSTFRDIEVELTA